MDSMDYTVQAESSSAGAKRSARLVTLEDGSPVDTTWLDQYATLYAGRRKINRMLFIARSCPQLANEAYSHALREIQEQTFDVSLYEQAVADLNSTRPPSDQLEADESWIERTRRMVADQQDKLEVELKNYQTNLIKESIRMAHRDIAAFQHKCGELQTALRTYLKSRDFATSTNQILEVCLAIIDVALDTQNYAFVRNYVVKAEAAYDTIFSSGTKTSSGSSAQSRGMPMPGMVGTSGNTAQQRQADAEDRRKTMIADRIAVASGIAEMGSGNYARAARKLLNIGSSARDADAGHFVSPGDVALVGVLCALASFDRGALKRQVMDNSNLRPLLELEPHLKEIVTAFHENNYKAALDTLQRYEPRHLLDIHLSNHVDNLVGLIRARAIVQYFVPFSTASLWRMATAFGWSEADMQAEVVRLIGRKDLKARVDSRNKVVHAYAPSQRAALFKHALETGREQEKAARGLLLHMNLVANDILVKAPKSQQAVTGGEEDGLAGSSPMKAQQLQQNSAISVDPA